MLIDNFFVKLIVFCSAGWHQSLASIFYLRKKLCQFLMPNFDAIPSRWEQFTPFWRFFHENTFLTFLCIVLTNIFMKTVFTSLFINLTYFSLNFKARIFKASFWCHLRSKSIFANIVHKIYYKIIKIPYGPLGSIKNTIP